jgi:hypothetical protein
VSGTPGKRFAENTVKGSVNTCARTGDTLVCTELESPFEAGGLDWGWWEKGIIRFEENSHEER